MIDSVSILKISSPDMKVRSSMMISGKSISVTRGTGLLESYLSKERCKKANQLIQPSHCNGRILDIGCGTYPYFLTTTRCVEKIGIDKVKQNSKAEELTKMSNGIEIINHDIEKPSHLPFSDNYFDVVTMLAVFEHLDPANILNVFFEVNRILKENGDFILTTPAVWSDKLLRIMAILNLVSREEIDEHKSVFSVKEIISFLDKGNFQHNKISYGYFEMFLNVWIVARK